MKKIFVSSTFEDLEEHREEIIHNLIKINRSFNAMEYFGSSPDQPVNYCKKKVNECDYFILLVGMRYGSKTESGKSITEIEYEEALKKQKNIHIYIIDENEHLILPKNVDKGDDAKKLVDLKKRLTQNHICQYFSSTKDLVNKVITDLINSLNEEDKNKIVENYGANFKNFIVDAGISSYGENISIDVSDIFNSNNLNEFSLSNIDIESLLAAAFLAQKIKVGELEILKHFISFKPPVRKVLIFFLSQQNINDSVLSEAISKSNDSLELRLLISIAGYAKATKCANIICTRLFDSVNHNYIIQQYNLSITPFYDVAKNALLQMGNKILPILEKHKRSASDKKRWQVKKLLESVIKNINKK